MISSASERVNRSSAPVRTKVLPAKRVSAISSRLSKLTPAWRSSSIWCRLWGLSNHRTIYRAVMGPTSPMLVSSSSEAAMSSSRVAKRRARTLAALAPTWRMPKAQRSLAKPRLLLSSRLLIRFSADFFPIRSAVAADWASRV